MSVLALLLAFASPDPAQIEQDMQEILGDERYGFCDAERAFIPVDEERAWCPLFDADNRRCPGYRVHCAKELGDGLGGGEDAAPWPGERRRKSRRGVFNEGAHESEQLFLPISAPLSAVAQLLLWGLAIGGVLLVLWAIARSRGAEATDEDAVPDTGRALAPTAAAGDVARDRVETDVMRLLERAKRAASEGEYRAAVDDVYAALLRRLDGDGLIRIHHGRTNGDYVHDLRERPELRARVRQILRDVETVQFGDAEPDESFFQRVLERVVPVITSRLTVLLLAFGLGTAAGCTAWQDEQADLLGLGTDPMGGRAVVQLLRRHDVEAYHRTRTIEQLNESAGAVLLFGDVRPSEEEWDALLAWVRSGGKLVVATGHDDLPASLGMEVVPGFEPDSEHTSLELVGGYRFSYESMRLRLPQFGRLEHTEGAGVASEMLVRTTEAPADEDEAAGEIYATQIHEGEGTVVVFADELLFTNASMAIDDNARFVVALLSSLGDEVEVVDEWTGTGAETPLESIENSHLAPVVLQLLAFSTLLYLWRGIAFARLRDSAPRGRRAFVEHVHALALQYAKARASRHVLGTYATWVLERLRDRVAPGSGRSLHGLAQAIAARTGRDEAAVMRLLVEAYTVRESASHASGVYTARKHDLELMRELNKLMALSARTKRGR